MITAKQYLLALLRQLQLTFLLFQFTLLFLLRFHGWNGLIWLSRIHSQVLLLLLLLTIWLMIVNWLSYLLIVHVVI